MCRLIAVLSKTPLLLDTVMQRSENSIIAQSLSGKGGHKVHGDGFGLGWYDHTLDPLPGLFRSVQPVWNDQNVQSLTQKLQSTCFVCHVRASTVGEVQLSNCHPFQIDNFLFAHNGTIDHFGLIRQEISGYLSPSTFAKLHGQTDSEMFFALLLHFLDERGKEDPAQWDKAFSQALAAIQKAQQNALGRTSFRINAVLTDGKSLYIMRYHEGDDKPAIPLYAYKGPFFNHDVTLIASEPLWDQKGKEQWNELPVNKSSIHS